MASSTGIFDDITTSMELFSSWTKRKATLDRERLQPYADLLLDNIVWPSVLTKKDSILAELKEKISKADHPSKLSVNVWTFSHVHDYPRRAAPVGGPAHAYDLERGDEDALRVKQVHENGWRQWMEVLDQNEYPTLYQTIIWDIVRKTDFCEQLAIRFGEKFRVSVVGIRHQEETDPSGETYSRSQYALSLGYFPFGLPDYHAKSRQTFLDSLRERERRTLKPGEKLVFWGGERAENVVYGPPLPHWREAEQVSTWPVEGPACHCGYRHSGYSSDEE
jgi:hypothetical protein